MVKRLAAEFIGTFALVLIGCGSIVLAGFGVVSQTGIAFAFGLALTGMFYGLEPISGCHINPAVSFGAWFAGRMRTGDMLGYWIAQCAGAVVGAGVLYLIASGAPGYDLHHAGLGQNGYGSHADDGSGSPGDYAMIACFVFEAVATFIFLVAYLGATQRSPGVAGIAIGLTLTAIHIVGMQVTGVSVNPARSLGPAVWVLGRPLMQLWLFVAAPMLGAAIAGLAFRAKLLSAEEA